MFSQFAFRSLREVGDFSSMYLIEQTRKSLLQPMLTVQTMKQQLAHLLMDEHIGLSEVSWTFVKFDNL